METMKKQWGKALVGVQEFVPQEYIAACDNTGGYVTYYFQCNAGSYTRWQDVYLETNGVAGLQTNGNPYTGVRADQYINEYHACNETHEVKVNAGETFNVDTYFPKGYVIADLGSYSWQHEYQVLEVRIWRGQDGKNLHCTTNIGEEHYVPHNPS